MAGLIEQVEPAVQRQGPVTEPALPPEMPVPYRPGELSKRYWALPAKERSRINAATDVAFAAQSGITRKLNATRAEDRPAVRMWLRLRDEQMKGAGVVATATVRPPAKTVSTADVDKLIAKHQTLKILDEAGLAKDLATHLPADPAFVRAVIKALYWWHQRDATSVEVCKLLSEADLVSLGAGSEGRALILLMVSEMQGVHTSADDKKQAQRAMHALSKAAIAQGRGVEIEVLTFRRGFAPLDWAGEHLFGKGAKGHTAVVAGGIAYSFDERGWIVAGTKESYLAENTYRDAIGQVLDVPEADAEKVQAALDDSVGTGTYLANKGAHVCTDEAARALEAALGTLNAKHNPQEFAKTLDATGKVKKTIDYPKKK